MECNGNERTRPVPLAVDDDRAVLQMVRRALSPIEVDVVVAPSAEEGLDAIEVQTPDVVLLDYVLPEMSGLEVLRKIRSLQPHLPVIFMTGRGSSDTAIEATVGGVDEYLRKPFDLDVVARSVKKALASRRHETNGTGEKAPKDHGDAIVGQSHAMQ